MLERRSHKIRDAELVTIAWDENGTTLKQLGHLEDLSSSGMGIIVSNAIPVGTLLSITYGDGNLIGIVRHKRPQEEAHFIGIELGLLSRNSTLHCDLHLLVL